MAYFWSLVSLGLDSIRGHFLVPKHEIVPEDKIKELVQKFGSAPDKFPQILKDDPIVLEIGAKRGDVIKITRNSPTAGQCSYYRVVA